MKFFIDTADISVVRDMMETGLVDGVTTNPTLIAKNGQDFKTVITEMCAVVCGPVSAEVAATDYATMMTEARRLSDLSPHVVIKLPLTVDGLRACNTLSDAGVAVNVTLCFSANQAILAAKAGARYVSPFVGRLDDLGHDGADLIDDIVTIFQTYRFTTEVLAASLRHPLHVQQMALLGADVVTVPPKVFQQLYKHPLTDAGLQQFTADWKASGQKI